MAEIHVNMKQLNKFKVYSDNVIAYDQIIQSKGKFFTDRPEIYTRWLDEYGIFYTLKGAEKEIRKANPAPRKRKMMAPFTIVKKAVEKLIRSRVETDYLGSWVGGELEVFIKREYATVENNRGQTKAYVKAVLNDQDTRYKLITQFAFSDLNGVIFNMPEPKANPAPRKRTAKKSGAEADYEAFAASVKKKTAPKKRAVSRPSQVTKKAPTKRLVSRRKLAAKKPVKGYFPNPRKAEKLVTLQIEIDRGNGWEFYTNFQHGKSHVRAITEMAKDAAQHAAKMNPSWMVRVIKK